MVEGVSVLVYNINAPETRLFFQPLVLFIYFCNNNNNNNCFLFLQVEMRLVLVKAHVALTVGDGIVHFAQFFPDQGFDPLRHFCVVGHQVKNSSNDTPRTRAFRNNRA